MKDNKSDRPVAINISGQAENNTITNPTINGNTDGVVISDDAKNNKVIGLKHTNETPQKKTWLLEHFWVPLVVSLIVVAIAIFLFQPWQNNIQESKKEHKEVQQLQQPNK